MLETGKQAYELPEGQIEYGMGFNGEMGIERRPLEPARDVMKRIADMLAEDMKLQKGEEIAVFLNPFKATTVLESYILTNDCLSLLRERGVTVYDTYVESLFPTQGAGGFSLSFLRMDDSYRPYYDRRAESPLFYKKEISHGRND